MTLPETELDGFEIEWYKRVGKGSYVVVPATSAGREYTIFTNIGWFNSEVFSVGEALEIFNNRGVRNLAKPVATGFGELGGLTKEGEFIPGKESPLGRRDRFLVTERLPGDIFPYQDDRPLREPLQTGVGYSLIEQALQTLKDSGGELGFGRAGSFEKGKRKATFLEVYRSDVRLGNFSLSDFLQFLPSEEIERIAKSHNIDEIESRVQEQFAAYAKRNNFVQDDGGLWVPEPQLFRGTEAYGTGSHPHLSPAEELENELREPWDFSPSTERPEDMARASLTRSRGFFGLFDKEPQLTLPPYTRLQRKPGEVNVDRRNRKEVLDAINLLYGLKDETSEVARRLDPNPLQPPIPSVLYRIVRGGILGTDTKELKRAYNGVWDLYDSLTPDGQRVLHTFLEKMESFVSPERPSFLRAIYNPIRRARPEPPAEGLGKGSYNITVEDEIRFDDYVRSGKFKVGEKRGAIQLSPITSSKYSPIRWAIKYPALAAGAAGIIGSEIALPGLPSLYRAGADLLFGSLSYFLVSAPISIISFYKDGMKLKASGKQYLSGREAAAVVLKSMVRTGVVKTLASGVLAAGILYSPISTSPTVTPSTQTPGQTIVPRKESATTPSYFGDPITGTSSRQPRKGDVYTLQLLGYDKTHSPTLLLKADGVNIFVPCTGLDNKFYELSDKLKGSKIELTRDPVGEYAKGNLQGYILSPAMVKVGHQTLVEVCK